MEIKKTIGKVFAAILVGFALMVLYTNAFPLSFSVKGGWVEDNDLGRVFYDKMVEYEETVYGRADNSKDKVNKAAIEDLKDYTNVLRNYYKYDEKTDKFYYRDTYTYTWAGLDFHTSSTNYGDIELKKKLTYNDVIIY